MRRRPRLSRSADFQRVYRQGRSVSSRHAVLYAFPREERTDADAGTEGEDGIRLGVSVGRKVGGAVERNRVKRLLREAFWSLGDRVSPEHDYVVVARQGIAEAAEASGLDALRVDLGALLDKLVGPQADEEKADQEKAGGQSRGQG